MEHDVFISHAHKDKNIADAICEKLESAHLKCWMTARAISASEDRTETTRNAIGSSRVMVLVLSENANSAPHIRREIAHAFYTRRTIIAFRLSNTLPRRDFLFYLGNASWFDAHGPDPEQHLEALTARITNLVAGRAATSNAMLPPGAIKTTPLNFLSSSIGALRASHYRTLGILKWVTIGAFIFALVWILWFALRQKGDVSLAENNVRSIDSGPTASLDSSSQAGGDSPGSKPGYIFTRFGLWEPANSSPTPLVQQGPPDMSSTSPTERSASATPSPGSDIDKKAAGEAERLAAQDSESVMSAQEDPARKINRREGHRGNTLSKGHNGKSSASEDSRFAKIKSRVEPGARLLATPREPKGEQDARQAQQNADLATKQNSALESQLKKAQEDAQQAQQNADLAAFHNSAPDTQSQQDAEDVQAGQEGVNLATSKPEPGQIQPPNPGQKEMPTAPTQPLDPSVQSVRP
jgi:hypothetical protein